jgi:hypothetical protein
VPTRRASRGFVITTAEPAAKALAADGPRFPVTLDHEVGKSGARGGVKQRVTRRKLGEYLDAPQAGAWGS